MASKTSHGATEALRTEREVEDRIGVGEVRQDLGDGEAIGSRFPPRILLGEFAHQPAQNLWRGFQLPDSRESVVFHLSILSMFSTAETYRHRKCGCRVVKYVRCALR